MDFEQSKFTGGLCLKPNADQLKPHELQEAVNVEVTREVGAVCSRRGIDKYYDRALSADEVFWQTVLDEAGPMARAGDRLYDELRPVHCGLTDAVVRFEEFGDHVVVANGYETLKYKRSGMGLTVHTAYCFDLEYDAIDACNEIIFGAHVQSFLYAYGDPLGEGDAEWRVTHEWERNYVEGETLDEDSDDFYTGTYCRGKHIGTTEVDVMDVCRAVDLGVPEGPTPTGAGGTISSNANAKLIVHCDGDDQATNFTDSAQGKTLTAAGAAQVDTAQYKFGTGSLLLDGTGDYVSTPGHNDFWPEDGPFGVDLWVRFNSVITDDKFRGFVAQGECGYGTSENHFFFGMRNGMVVLRLYHDGYASAGMAFTWTPAADQWYHLYACRGWGGVANRWAVCIDGNKIVMDDLDFEDILLTDNFIIGAALNEDEEYYGIDGWEDEVRWVKGEAPWTANFTPPATAYVTALSGDFYYKVTNVNYDEHEGNAGGGTLVSPSSQIVQLTIPVSNDPQVVARNIYRTEDAGSTYKFLARLDNNFETTYEDNAPDTWLGDTLATTQDEPPVFSEVHDRQSLLWGIEAAAKNTVWYANAFDDWDAYAVTQYELFGANTNESVALESLGEYLVVVQKTRIWRFNTEEDPEVLTESYSSVGAPCGGAVINLGDALLVVNAFGVYYFDAIKELKVSQKIEPLFDSGGSNAYRLDHDYLTNLRTGYMDDKVYVSYTAVGSVVNNRTLVYDRVFKTFDGIISQGFTSFTTDKDGKRLLATGTDGYVYLLDTGNDDGGSGISWSWRTKDFADELVGASIDVSEGELKQRSHGKLLWKKGGKIRVDVDPAEMDMTLQVYLDDTVRQTRTLSNASRTVSEFRVPPDYHFTRMSLRFSGTTSVEQKIYGVRVMGVTIVGEGG